MTLKIKSVEPEACRTTGIPEGRWSQLGVSAYECVTSHKGSNYKNMFATVLIIPLE